MNPEQLAALGKAALAQARYFVAYKEALVAQGVTDEEATRVARDSAMAAAFYKPDSGERCPLCGRGG